MEAINESEQWKLKGDCLKCRKQKYCTKQCSASKENLKKELLTTFWEKRFHIK